MQNRKKFIQTIGISVVGLAIIPEVILSKSNNAVKTIVIGLDGVRKQDMMVGLKKTMAFISNTNTILYDNLHTTANLDFHEESYMLVFKNNSYLNVDLRETETLDEPINNVLFTGFDVAHYNIDLYHELVSKADNLISNILTNDGGKSQFIIINTMGRNDFENAILNNNGNGGFDHNDETARECMAIKVFATNGELNITTDSRRLSTTEFTQQII